MQEEEVERRLAAILFLDVAGYSRLMDADEAATHQRLKEHRQEVIDKTIDSHQGKICHTAGDGILAEFQSATQALVCAIQIQQAMKERNADEAKDRRIECRIGINVGDVIVEPDDIYGDGVNVAARLEKIAEPGGICISGSVYNIVSKQFSANFQALGDKQFKNISEPVAVYKVDITGSSSPVARTVSSKRAFAIAASLAVILVVGGLAWNFRAMLFSPEDQLATQETRSFPTARQIDKPSIAVLPFKPWSAEPEEAYFADGLTEDLILDLSMSSDLFVIARTSSFSYKHQDIDIREIARQLGVRYVLEGSADRSPEKLRITAQLIDGSTGGHIWAQRFDRMIADYRQDVKGLLDLRDEITRAITASLITTAGQIAKAEQKLRSRKPPSSYDAYDHYLLGREYFHRSILPPWDVGQKQSQLAKQEFEKAIAKDDPPYWRAYGGLAWQHAIDWDWEYSEDPQRSLDLAFEKSQIAVKNDPDDYLSRWILGWAYLFTKRDHAKAMEQYEKARQINPNDTRLLAEMSQPLVYTGQYEKAIDQLTTAIRLNPLHREQWVDEFLAWAYEENGQPEKAIAELTRLSELEGWWSHAVLAAAYAQLGETEQAANQVAVIDEFIREIYGEPFTADFWRSWVEGKYPYQDPDRTQRKIDMIADAIASLPAE